MDVVDSQGWDDDDIDSRGMVFRTGGGGVAINTNGSGGDFDDATELYN